MDQETLDMVNWVDMDRVTDCSKTCDAENANEESGILMRMTRTQQGRPLSMQSFYDSEYDMIDDQLYDNFVDHYVEFVGVNKGKILEKKEGVDGVRSTIMDANNKFYGEGYDTNELVSISGSSSDDEEGGNFKRQMVKYSHFNVMIDMVDPQLKFSLLFKYAFEFRAAVRQHEIK
ncbi:unnamed protein product [Ilex paraguariensis]|uniref:Protein FAR1-RELATED SEQUENCE n=1 Tax=Ilex paraguariensis TaxID=185542 RepID=A0ABC8R8G8_9AQUA